VISQTSCKRLSASERVGLCRRQSTFKRWCKSSGQPGGLIFEPPLCLCLLWLLQRLLSGRCEPVVCEKASDHGRGRTRSVVCAKATSQSMLLLSCVQPCEDIAWHRRNEERLLLTCCSSLSVACPTPLSSKSFLDASTTSWMIFS